MDQKDKPDWEDYDPSEALAKEEEKRNTRTTREFASRSTKAIAKRSRRRSTNRRRRDRAGIQEVYGRDPGRRGPQSRRSDAACGFADRI